MSAFFRTKSSKTDEREEVVLFHRDTNEQEIESDVQSNPSKFWDFVAMFNDGFEDHLEHTQNGREGGLASTEYHFKFDLGEFFDRGEILGRGSLGVVQVLRIRGTGIKVACKSSTESRHISNLQKEVGLLRTFDHDHIVRLIGSCETTQKRPQFSMILSPVGDQDLKSFLEQASTASLRSNHDERQRIEGWFGCLASALCYLHNKGVRHEDIKPSNTIHRGDRVLFTDFSSSTIYNPEDTTSTESPAYGTRTYAAPEFLDKKKCHGARSDVFSLGCVFVEMLTVICGSSPNELHKFCRERCQSEGGPFLYSNSLGPLNTWFLEVKPRIATMISWREIVQPMLQLDRKQRPTSTQIARLLGSGPVWFFGENCVCYSYSYMLCLPGAPMRGSKQDYGEELNNTDPDPELNSVEMHIRQLRKLRDQMWNERPLLLKTQPELRTFPAGLEYCFTMPEATSSAKHVKAILHFPHHTHDWSSFVVCSQEHGDVIEHFPGVYESRNWERSCMRYFLSKVAAHRTSLKSDPETTLEAVEEMFRYGCRNSPGADRWIQETLESINELEDKHEVIGIALAGASLKGHGNIVTALLTYSPNLGALNNALWVASDSGHESIVRILIENGADGNAETMFRSTARQAASSVGHTNIVYLIQDSAARSQDHLDNFQDPRAE